MWICALHIRDSALYKDLRPKYKGWWSIRGLLCMVLYALYEIDGALYRLKGCALQYADVEGIAGLYAYSV